MVAKRTIASIDIGNSKIRVIVGTLDGKSNLPLITGVGMSPSHGLRKGMVIDVEETINCIASALEDAERMAGDPIHHVFIGLSGTHLESTNSKGVVAIANPNAEILEQDIDRVLEAAQAVSIPSNRTILRVIPKSFSVDEQRGIKYPVGMSGIRLEVDAHILTGLAPAVKNLEKCVLQAGVDINDIIPNVIAAPEAVLSKRQKELGVVVLDIGHSSSSLAIYEEGTILASHIIPVGGESVTNDIAIGLRTAIDTAERVKIEYGTCQPQEVPDREMIDLSLISKNDFQQISRRNLAEIIQARYHELFTLAKEELKNAGRDGMLPAGVILTGAAVKIPGIVELARDTLNLPVQIGFPQNFEGIVDKIDDPAYATAIGLLIWGSRFESVSPGLGLNLDFKNININKMLDEAKGWLKNLLP